jgi:hypothetical protein
VADGDVVDLGVELLRHHEAEQLTVKEALDCIEAVTRNPPTQRAILEAAADRGVVERGGGVVRPRGGTFVRFDSDVVTKEGEFSCRRCGTELSTGHFIRLDGGDVGPFGSTCIRKVTGRE